MSGPSLTVFVGPSLRAGDHAALAERAAAAGFPFGVRPPLRRGDLVGLVDAGDPGDVVLILDGEFGQELAVSVLEIRAALAAGRLVLGASSMGALRAAECDVLGMLGFGWIFRGFRDATLQSDAEVSLLFDPYELQPITVPLVNVRWILHEAVEAGVVSPALAARLVRDAAALHFRDRTPRAVAAAWATVAELADPDCAVLVELLAGEDAPQHDRKRLDALDALEIAVQLRANAAARALPVGVGA